MKICPRLVLHRQHRIQQANLEGLKPTHCSRKEEVANKFALGWKKIKLYSYWMGALQ
jgi:hypothetical protein